MALAAWDNHELLAAGDGPPRLENRPPPVSEASASVAGVSSRIVAASGMP